MCDVICCAQLEVLGRIFRLGGGWEVVLSNGLIGESNMFVVLNAPVFLNFFNSNLTSNHYSGHNEFYLKCHKYLIASDAHFDGFRTSLFGIIQGR